MKENGRKYKYANKEQLKDRQRKRAEQLTDSYVKASLCQAYKLSAKDITPEMIELKRQQLFLTRLIRKQKK